MVSMCRKRGVQSAMRTAFHRDGAHFHVFTRELCICNPFAGEISSRVLYTFTIDEYSTVCARTNACVFITNYCRHRVLPWPSLGVIIRSSSSSVRLSHPPISLTWREHRIGTQQSWIHHLIAFNINQRPSLATGKLMVMCALCWFRALRGWLCSNSLIRLAACVERHIYI